MEEGRIENYLNEMPNSKKSKKNSVKSVTLAVSKMGISGTTANNPNTQGALTVIPTATLNNMAERRKKNSKRTKPVALTLQRAVVRARSGNMNMANIYLESLVNPRDTEGIRLPDPFCRQHTATYQAKVVYNVTGVSGALVTTANQGRFCYVFNPVIDQRGGTFNAFNNYSQVAIKDGPIAANWVSPFIGADQYAPDAYLSMWTAGANPVMSECRPVSMSVLASYNGNLIQGGGNIAIALVRGGAWVNNLTNSTIGANNLANWENLAEFPGAYDGPLIKGGYAYWLPDDETDYLLRDTNQAKTNTMGVHDYPVIVVSGQNGSPSGTTGMPPYNTFATCLRIDCYINYEYTTLLRTQATSPGPSDTWMRETAMHAICYQPTSMPNEWHQKFIASVIGGVGGFFLGGPAGALVGALAPWAPQIKDTVLKGT